MRSYPTEVAPMMIVVVVALVLAIVVSRLLNHCRSRIPRLRMLTGSPPQRAALRAALAPVVCEFLPLLERAGQEVRAIVVVPTLSGSGGEPLAAELEQLSGSSAFIVRLAHRLGSTVRQPDEVAGALAEDLLYLYRHAVPVTVVRQTDASASVHTTTTPKAAGRNGLVAVPRHATQNEAEETAIAFKPNPLGPRNGQGA